MRKHKFGNTVIALAIAGITAIGPFAAEAAAQTAPAQPAAGAPAAQVPQPEEGGVNWSGVGLGAGAVFGSLLYIPFKLTYAILGSLVGGGAYLLTGGNTQTADTIWRSSLGGDYVLTPDMIAGNQPINFSGPTNTPPETPAAAAPSVSGSPVAPIAPLPPPSSAQPLDRGSGPAAPGGGSPLPNTSIE